MDLALYIAYSSFFKTVLWSKIKLDLVTKLDTIVKFLGWRI